jgi:hypothetical protein
MDDAPKIPGWKRAVAGLLRLPQPAQSRAIWQHHPYYWLLRKRLSLFSFRLLRTGHTIGTKARSKHESIQMIRIILQSIGGALVAAIVLVFAVAWIEGLFKDFIFATAAYVSRWPWLAHLYESLKLFRLDGGVSGSLLSTLAQIAGVFLGLYFAAVGTLISARYSNVPSNVRELMFTDKLGNQYIKMVARFGAVATLLLGAQSIGVQIGLLNMVVVTILGVATILSFVSLGRRSFDFLDPRSLVSQLGPELISWIDRATKLHVFNRQQSFQAFYQKQAASLLKSYDGVVRVAAQDAVSRQHTLPYLAQNLLEIWVYYGKRKHYLESNSFWFRRQHAYKNWLTTDFTETSIALNTGTTLPPKEVPDAVWFEKELGETFWFAYRALLEGNHLEQAAHVNLSAAEAIGRLAECMLVSEAADLANAWTPFFRSEARKTIGRDDVMGQEGRDLVQRLRMVDCYAFGAIRMLLSFVNSVSGASSERLRIALSEPDWLSGDGIYKLNAPRTAIAALEQLRSQIDFERRVEGARITATWYLRQRAAFAYCSWYKESLDSLLTLFERSFGGDLDTLIAEKCWLAAASLSSRASEACNKFQHHLGRLKASHERWMEWRGRAEGDWPSVDWDSVAGRVSQLEERVEIATAALLVPLSPLQKRAALPDFFGHALGTSTKSCFDAIASDRGRQVAKIFPSLFQASFLAHNRLKNELKEQPLETILIFSTEPIDNLMELSGYAIIYSEFGPKDTWQEVKATWDTYFKNAEDPQEIARWMLAVMQLRTEGFWQNPGAIQRTSWKQSFEQDMRRRGLREDPYGGPHWNGRPQNQHKSPIVRTVLRDGMFSDMSDVFLTVYLLQQPFTKDPVLPRRTESFVHSYKREQQRGTETGDKVAE